MTGFASHNGLDKANSPPFYISTNKPAPLFSATIAAATTVAAFALGKAGLYEITVESAATGAAVPQRVFIRNSADTRNLMVISCPTESCVTRRFRTSEDGSALSIRLRNDGVGSVVVHIFLVE